MKGSCNLVIDVIFIFEIFTYDWFAKFGHMYIIIIIIILYIIHTHIYARTHTHTHIHIHIHTLYTDTFMYQYIHTHMQGWTNACQNTNTINLLSLFANTIC